VESDWCYWTSTVSDLYTQCIFWAMPHGEKHCRKTRIVSVIAEIKDESKQVRTHLVEGGRRGAWTGADVAEMLCRMPASESFPLQDPG
jgi:hypothetical protein